MRRWVSSCSSLDTSRAVSVADVVVCSWWFITEFTLMFSVLRFLQQNLPDHLGGRPCGAITRHKQKHTLCSTVTQNVKFSLFAPLKRDTAPCKYCPCGTMKSWHKLPDTDATQRVVECCFPSMTTVCHQCFSFCWTLAVNHNCVN